MISGSILIISAISVSILLLISVVFTVTVYSAFPSGSDSTPEVSLSGVSCHDKILGYARIGAYGDAATFKAAMSFCSVPSGV
jgi:hypothetical protein